jgi:hypothetical protein
LEIKNILYRKEMKLVTLLLTSMLIASASAAVYYSLTMKSTVEVFGTSVFFVKGEDNATAGLTTTITGNGTYVTLTGLRAYPNASFTYEDPIRVRNNASSAVDIRLTPSSISGGATNIVFVKFILNGTGVGTRSLNYTSNGSTWSNTGMTSWITMPATNPDTEWSIIVQTKAKEGAVSDSVAIEILVDAK